LKYNVSFLEKEKEEKETDYNHVIQKLEEENKAIVLKNETIIEELNKLKAEKKIVERR